MSDKKMSPEEKEKPDEAANATTPVVDEKAAKMEIEEAATKEEASEPVAEQIPEVPPIASSEEVVAPSEENEKIPEANVETEAPISEELKNESNEEEEEMASSDDEDSDEHHEEDAHKDYHNLSKTELVAAFQSLLKSKPVQEIKNEVEEIKNEFNTKFSEELEQKKEAFLAEGGNIIDFHYTTPLKKEFNSLYFDYREKRSNHYKNLKKDLQANLQKRQELIEELKGLLNAEENINTTYKHFKDIQERWHVSGAIPRDKYNIVWNTYHHHVENFYDFLHLNREFRDLDFKHNLEQKLKLIGRAEELAQESNINKAFRELQMLHKMWKEEVGPVAKQYRDEVWDKFSAATKVIHDKRQESLKDQEKDFEENYKKKKLLIEQIKTVVSSVKPSHQAWQNAMKEVQKLRDAYFEIGKVPRAHNKEIWNLFKETTRVFNKEKNTFYKNQKKEQYINLEKKRELIKIAEENKDSDDFEVVTPLMKKIQNDWKKIGHVPRKDSDKIWKEFKESCNYYFGRLHAQKDEANKEEVENYKAKSAMLEALSSFELSGDTKKDVSSIKEKITEWKEIGRVPYSKKNIDRKFHKTMDGLFEKLNLDKKETELIKFENKINTMISQEDDRKLQNEQFFISKKIDESKNEIRQLENNLGFFQHVDSNNPLVKDVHKNIARHKEQLEVWKAKLKKIKSLR